jgi:hypothetical protein
LSSPDRDRYHRSGKAMKERRGQPPEGISNPKKIQDHDSNISRTGRFSRLSERYWVVWDRNFSVPFTYYPATPRMDDTNSIAWTIALHWIRKRSISYCGTAILITKPFAHVNTFSDFVLVSQPIPIQRHIASSLHLSVSQLDRQLFRYVHQRLAKFLSSTRRNKP